MSRKSGFEKLSNKQKAAGNQESAENGRRIIDKVSPRLQAWFNQQRLRTKNPQWWQRRFLIHALLKKGMKHKRCVAGQTKKRIAVLVCIFIRIYENDINSTISYKRFLKLSAEYRTQEKEVDAYKQNKNDFDSCAIVIHKCTGITDWTPTIVNEFRKKIIVHAPKKINDNRFQKTGIIFNFMRELHLPSDPQMEQKAANKQEKTE